MFDDEIKSGETLATLYTAKENLLDAATICYLNAVEIDNKKPAARQLSNE